MAYSTREILRDVKGNPIPQIWDAVADAFVPAEGTVVVTGSRVDQRGLAANRPAANAVAIGTTYWSVDTGAIEVSDGTIWRAI